MSPNTVVAAIGVGATTKARSEAGHLYWFSAKHDPDGPHQSLHRPDGRLGPRPGPEDSSPEHEGDYRTKVVE